jgi:hypothetical protein
MPSHCRPFSAVALTFWLAGPAVPVAAQEAGRRWTLTASGGYASQLDPGSTSQGSVSFSASALRPRSRALSLGIEGGYDRYETFEEVGEQWWNGSNVTSSECPAPCTWQRIRFNRRYVNSAWHLKAVLRYTFLATGALVPSAEVGVGLYEFRSHSEHETRDVSTDALVPDMSGRDTSTGWAPGVSVALGVDLFPRNGRIGVGAVVRLHAAGRPADGRWLGNGLASLQARVTVR